MLETLHQTCHLLAHSIRESTERLRAATAPRRRRRGPRAQSLAEQRDRELQRRAWRAWRDAVTSSAASAWERDGDDLIFAGCGTGQVIYEKDEPPPWFVRFELGYGAGQGPSLGETLRAALADPHLRWCAQCQRLEVAHAHEEAPPARREAAAPPPDVDEAQLDAMGRTVQSYFARHWPKKFTDEEVEDVVAEVRAGVARQRAKGKQITYPTTFALDIAEAQANKLHLRRCDEVSLASLTAPARGGHGENDDPVDDQRHAVADLASENEAGGARPGATHEATAALAPLPRSQVERLAGHWRRVSASPPRAARRRGGQPNAATRSLLRQLWLLKAHLRRRGEPDGERLDVHLAAAAIVWKCSPGEDWKRIKDRVRKTWSALQVERGGAIISAPGGL